jgi:hypothetical protein
MHCLGMHDAVLYDMGVHSLSVRCVGVPGVGSSANFRLLFYQLQFFTIRALFVVE